MRASISFFEIGALPILVFTFKLMGIREFSSEGVNTHNFSLSASTSINSTLSYKTTWTLESSSSTETLLSL